MEQEFSAAILVGDAGGGLGGRESLNGEVADEGEGDFAGVKNADALIEFGLAEDSDAEEVAGADEEAFRWGGGGIGGSDNRWGSRRDLCCCRETERVSDEEN